MSKPKIVTLCGSSRFVDIFAIVGWWLERDENKIVMGLHLLPSWYGENLPTDHLAEHEGVADQLDALHLAKIDLSDEVFVINWKGYIGDSTTHEVRHAMARGLPIRWLEPPPDDFVSSSAYPAYSPVYDPMYHDRLADLIVEASAKRTSESA